MSSHDQGAPHEVDIAALEQFLHSLEVKITEPEYEALHRLDPKELRRFRDTTATEAFRLLSQLVEPQAWPGEDAEPCAFRVYSSPPDQPGGKVLAHWGSLIAFVPAPPAVFGMPVTRIVAKCEDSGHPSTHEWEITPVIPPTPALILAWLPYNPAPEDACSVRFSVEWGSGDSAARCTAMNTVPVYRMR